jgi:hypothetical protein
MPETLLGIPTEALGIWLAALVTLAIYSFLYKDNPVYKFAEHMFVGVSAGYTVGIAYHEVALDLIIKPLFRPAELKLTGPDYLVLIPTVLGLMMFLRFSRKYGWAARWPICFVMGYGVGAGIPPAIKIFLVQAHGTIQPLVPVSPEAHTTAVQVIFQGFSSLVLVAGVICTLGYFYFSREHKGALGVVSRIGMWLLMIAFGAGFGNTVMARISLLIGRFQFLIDKWWPQVRGLF